MNKVIINDVKDTVSELFDPDGEFVGYITSELQLNDVRIQIMKGGLEGYTIRWIENEHVTHIITINSTGHIPNWPNGFYDILLNQLTEL